MKCIIIAGRYTVSYEITGATPPPNVGDRVSGVDQESGKGFNGVTANRAFNFQEGTVQVYLEDIYVFD